MNKASRIVSRVLLVIALGLILPNRIALASASSEFPDLGGSKYKVLVEKAAADGWVNGYPDGTFRPGQDIGRWEFAKLLLASAGLYPGSNQAEEVIQNASIGEEILTMCDSSWAYQQGWSEIAFAYGIVDPADYGFSLPFPPDTTISRYEAVTYVERMLGIYDAATRRVVEENELPFTDLLVMPCDYGVIATAVEYDLIPISGTHFDPTGGIARDEAVSIVWRVLELLK